MTKTNIALLIARHAGFQDLTDRAFNQLTAVECMGRVNRGTYSVTQWKWRCVCGTEIIRSAGDVKTGHIKDCGCISKKPLVRYETESYVRHGRSKTPEYNVWNSMKSRCYNPKAESFPHYGGRGIKVCDRWFHFHNFIQDMGPRPSRKHSIERRNNDGDYEPDNCFWATHEEQAVNKRNNVMLTHGGQTLALSEWARRVGVGRGCLWIRLFRRHWSIEKALTTPLRVNQYR